MSDQWETVVHTDAGVLDGEPIRNIIEMETSRARMLRQLEKQQEVSDFTETPPIVTDNLFSGLIGKAVELCCHNSEAVPVAVAMNIISWFTALIGPTVYYQLGDERRMLNNYYLLVGPSGMGKGSSEHGPDRIFHRVEQFLQEKFTYAYEKGKTDGINEYPLLDIHDGGLSSGEGLAAAKNDGVPDKPEMTPVPDKRILIKEPEFGNVLNMAQRQGNTLSHVLRNGYDGKTIKPLTKRDKVCVTHPFFCMIGNITPQELAEHNRSSVMSSNGMLNRTMMIWTRVERRQPIPEAIPQDQIDWIASELTDSVMFARNHSFETHWKKLSAIAQPVVLGESARTLWIDRYDSLVNLPDCNLVKTLCRRHRLHTLILASVFALLDKTRVIEVGHLESALAWFRYSRDSVVYSYRTFSSQESAASVNALSHDILQVIASSEQDHGFCTCSDIYHWYHNKLSKELLHKSLNLLITHIPPLIQQLQHARTRGRPVQRFVLSKEGWSRLNCNLTEVCDETTASTAQWSSD